MTWTDMVGSGSKGSRVATPQQPENRTFSIDAMLKTMAREYFTIIGTLSSSPRGYICIVRQLWFFFLRPLT